ncbi:alpha/beta fold hydrolase [Amycolatopsis jejuensis]|uniref:alpha/beta fold hydrolase n=1 Tax=Amycolatopsis jejuensis TaxID=330084 RepID=UPI000526159B|nr:alpha/beta hydrolase [Amycolatopsis jejuensis]
MTATARVGELELCYETLGDPGDPALLLVMGFGVQMTEWDRAFVAAFADAGFHVIRYDHRDTGLSAKLDGLSYGLEDMADDGIGLVRALGITQVHVLGASMGGMIAQLMAIRHPDVVLSLCSIMSTTGAPGVGSPRPGVLEAMAAPVPASRAQVADQAVRNHHLVSGGGYPVDEEAARQRAQEAYDRSYYPEGRLRQQQAVRSATDRTAALGRLRIPVVVVHGADDPLVQLSGGEATAAAIPGAELVVFPGMGHEFPVELHGRIVEAFAQNARKTGRTGR